MVRKLLLVVCLGGGLLAAVEGYRAYQSGQPRHWNVEEARQHLHSPQKEYVVLHGQLDTEHRVYNWTGNDVFSSRPELSSTSPGTVFPLFGPQATPPEQWSRFIGKKVLANPSLSVMAGNQFRIGGGHPKEFYPLHVYLPAQLGGFSLPERRVGPGGGIRVPGETMPEASGRYILAYLGHDVWVLSPPHLHSGSVGERRLHKYAWFDEEEWAEQKTHSGYLYRMKALSGPSLSFADIEARFREQHPQSQLDLRRGWLIGENEKGHSGAPRWLIAENQEGQSASPQSKGSNSDPGYFVFVPVKGSDNTIWVQIPLEDERDDWQQFASGELTGIWFPAGTHFFVPDASGAKEGEVVLLRVDQPRTQRFLYNRLTKSWGIVPMLFVGLGLFVVAGGLLYITAPARKAVKHESAPPEG